MQERVPNLRWVVDETDAAKIVIKHWAIVIINVRNLNGPNRYVFGDVFRTLKPEIPPLRFVVQRAVASPLSVLLPPPPWKPQQTNGRSVARMLVGVSTQSLWCFRCMDLRRNAPTLVFSRS